VEVAQTAATDAGVIMYKIAISTMALTGKIPAGDHRWAKFNDSFINQELEAIDVVNAIYTGHSYAAWHNGRRCLDNFVCAQHIAVDLETGDQRSTIDYIAASEFVRIYGGLIYTTPSHTTTDPRARIVFFLDKPIANAAAYKTAVGFIYSLFPGSDSACVDASRFFYGSKDCQLEWINNVLPLSHLRRYYTAYKPGEAETAQPDRHKTQPGMRQEATTPTAHTDEKLPRDADVFLDYAIKDSTSEGRNKRGYRLARQLKEIGLSKFDAEVYMRRYQQSVGTAKNHNYTEHEALLNLNSAYTRAN